MKLTSWIEEMIRVDHAGEYGARRIYKGQLAVLKGTPAADHLQEMADQEEEHYQHFNTMMIEHTIRPTLLEPIWHVAGYALGAVTALMGPKAAHACTIAVEEVIEEHYESQLHELKSFPSELQPPTLQPLIEKCQADEIAHKDLAIALGGQEAVGYPILRGFIKAASKLAITLSKKI